MDNRAERIVQSVSFVDLINQEREFKTLVEMKILPGLLDEINGGEHVLTIDSRQDIVGPRSIDFQNQRVRLP